MKSRTLIAAAALSIALAAVPASAATGAEMVLVWPQIWARVVGWLGERACGGALDPNGACRPLGLAIGGGVTPKPEPNKCGPLIDPNGKPCN